MEYPEYPPSPVYRSAQMEHSAWNDTQFSDPHKEKIFFDDESACSDKAIYDELKIVSNRFVKVNYPQYGTELLPNGTPLDLTSVMKNMPPTAPFMDLFQIGEDHRIEESVLIEILNFEMRDEPNTDRTRWLERVFGDIFGCGDMSETEISRHYPWTTYLLKLQGEENNLPEIAHNVEVTDGIENIEMTYL